MTDTAAVTVTVNQYFQLRPNIYLLFPDHENEYYNSGLPIFTLSCYYYYYYYNDPCCLNYCSSCCLIPSENY